MRISSDAGAAMTLVQQIKEEVSMYDVASMLSIELPKRSGIKFRSPFRPDKNPSCSIYSRGNEWRFRDWSHGIDVDQIGFYALARTVSNAEAIRELAHQVNERSNGRSERRITSAIETTKSPPLPPIDRPAVMPSQVAESWREGIGYLARNTEWQRRIAHWRGWPPEIVSQLVEDGMLGTPVHKCDRLVAFRVDYPVVKDFGAFGTWFCTEQVGFHVRLKAYRASEKPSWRFYPNGRDHG